MVEMHCVVCERLWFRLQPWLVDKWLLGGNVGDGGCGRCDRCMICVMLARSSLSLWLQPPSSDLACSVRTISLLHILKKKHSVAAMHGVGFGMRVGAECTMIRYDAMVGMWC